MQGFERKNYFYLKAFFMQALLIIDMQKISFIVETPRYDTPGTCERINILSKAFRKANKPVIFIQHDGSKQNMCMPNTEEWEILDELNIEDEDVILPKTANDSFYRTKLDELLNKKAVNELLVTGCATDFCVDATVRSALVHDYNVTVVADAHTTADRPNLTAKQVIDYYNWLWTGMIPTEGILRVITTSDVLQIIT